MVLGRKGSYMVSASHLFTDREIHPPHSYKKEHDDGSANVSPVVASEEGSPGRSPERSPKDS